MPRDELIQINAEWLNGE
jgi:membrane protein involved in colicin uptake